MSAVEPGGVHDVGVQAAQPQEHRDGDGEEDHEGAQDHDGKSSVTDPQHHEGRDGDAGNRLTCSDIGQDGSGEQSPAVQGPGQGQSEHGGQETAEEGLTQRDPGSPSQPGLSEVQPQAGDDRPGAGQEDLGDGPRAGDELPDNEQCRSQDDGGKRPAPLSSADTTSATSRRPGQRL